ncbi:Ca2+-binding RTX toxin-like protein [Rhizobium azooxidifex]|uniref:Ca2+-binding RTX toxin-like protein n=1 Tax=Mycoplana azooxidifex TaxID=1636188 RepID=A0A7W6GMY0_9HYPH|nr:FG-GAP-like repeat-containing protein [Mycoplana azooxidifex]MBB3979399.1 Ca2+-binding RTX toxin-like protein [Mycoplana azooxidifex]
MSAPTISITPTTISYDTVEAVGGSTQAQETLVIDANGDGHLDLVLNGRNAETITVLLNQGDGTFGTPTTIENGYYWHMFEADIEGDGRQDILVAKWNEDYSSQTLGYLKNNGDGTFGEFQELSSGFNNVLDIASVDFDGDGDLDMLAAASNGAGIVLTKNNGDGTFTNSIVAEVPSAYSVATGDLNGDGRLDLIASNAAGDISVFTVNADGTTTSGQVIEADNVYSVEKVTLVDLDGDGSLDIVAANSNRKELTWYKGGGDGTFGDKQIISAGTYNSGYVSSFQVVDINGDGLKDIVAGSRQTVGDTANTQQSYLSWFEQLADGSFKEHMTAALYPDNADFFGVSYGDLNGDGVADLITAGPAVKDGVRSDVRVAFGMQALEVNENEATAITGIAFSDDQAGPVSVTLTVDRGTLEGDATFAGVTVTGGGGTITLVGSIADINAFIAAGGATFTTANNDETTAKLSISIDDQDAGGASTTTKTIALAVTPAHDEAPTDLTLDGHEISEAADVGTVIGTLSGLDPEGGAVTYSLYSSAGSMFSIEGNQLKLNGTLDFESESSYEIIVRAKDAGGNVTDKTFTIGVTNANEAPTAVTLSKVLVPQSAEAGTVVGTLAATDPDSGDTFTYSIPGGSDAFEIVDNKLVVKDLGDALTYDVKVLATDSGGLTVEKTFRITTTDDDGNPLGSAGTITIDASNAASMDFEAYIRGGFVAGTEGGGMPVFDNSAAFSGHEMMLGYGTEPTSKYVVAGGSLEYYFNTHTVWGEINTIEYGIRGSGSYDGSGSFKGGSAELRITGLTLENGKPASALEEADIEANGPVHNFALSHMYGAAGSPTRLAVYADSLDAYAQNYIGSSGADVYTGTVFADTIKGGGGDDTLNGGAGGDTITGGAGNDVVDGGEGTDTFIVSGKAADYNALVLTTTYLTDNTTGEMDRLKNVEFIKFKDALFNVATQEYAPIENAAPTDLGISATSVKENVATGTTVGTLSATDPEGSALTYSLSSNPGGYFKIVGNKLQVAKALDHEAKASHVLTFTATDEDGKSTSSEITVKVTDVNEAPASLSLSATKVRENVAVGTTVGTLSATDPEGKALTYKLTDSAGGLFKLSGNKLVTAKAINYEALKSDKVTVAVTDNAGLKTTKTFTISVTDVNEAPTSLSLSSTKIKENVAIGTTVGTLSAKDPEGKALTYKLTDSAGGLFKISGNKLVTAKAVDYEKVQKETVTVQVSDGTSKIVKTFGISVTDVVDTIKGSSASQTLKGGVGVDRIDGAGGNDVLHGLAGGDTLLGGTGNDTLVGGAGADRLDGGTGKDTASYADAKTGVTASLAKASLNTNDARGDTFVSMENLSGSRYADKLYGNGAANSLSGQAGNDRLSGAGGNDKLEGGAGHDDLYGGAGKDTFVFRSAKDLGTKKSATDTIFDFDRKDGDKIDLSGIDASTKAAGNQAFTFIGSDAWHKKAGELRFEKAGPDTYVHGDTNGDGKSDFILHLDDAIALKAGDFLL